MECATVVFEKDYFIALKIHYRKTKSKIAGLSTFFKSTSISLITGDIF